MVYKWFYNVHRVTYALGIIGYMVIMGTFMGLNVLLLVKPDLAMQVGVLVIFYGLYYGVLGRDCAELCADKMAAKMGVSSLFFHTKLLFIKLKSLPTYHFYSLLHNNNLIFIHSLKYCSYNAS